MSFICAQSRQGESVISRQRRKADYHCLDPWTAETSGKWPSLLPLSQRNYQLSRRIQTIFLHKSSGLYFVK